MIIVFDVFCVMKSGIIFDGPGGDIAIFISRVQLPTSFERKNKCDMLCVCVFLLLLYGCEKSCFERSKKSRYDTVRPTVFHLQRL